MPSNVTKSVQTNESLILSIQKNCPLIQTPFDPNF